MWTASVLIGLPILAFIALIAIAVITITIRKGWKDAWGLSDAGMVGVIATGVLVIVSLIMFLVLMPFDTDYLKYQEYSGTVVSIDKRILTEGEGISEKFVVNFGDGVQLGCGDTRCASVREGDELTLNCLKKWDYFGTDGYDCKFIRIGEK